MLKKMLKTVKNYVPRKKKLFLLPLTWSSSNQLSCVCPKVLHNVISFFNILMEALVLLITYLPKIDA